MKIILTESQIQKILVELYGKNKAERIMDILLDKVSNDGYESLSPREKEMLSKLSRGENVDYDDEEETEKSFDDSSDDDTLVDDKKEYIDDTLSLFLDNFPDGHEFNSAGSLWKINVTDMDTGVGLIVHNEENEIEIIPFVQEGNKILITFKDKTWVLTIKKIPKTIDEMKKFIDEFLKGALPKIISQIIK